MKSRAASCALSRNMWIKACCRTAFPMPAKRRNTTRSMPLSGSLKRLAPIWPTPAIWTLCATSSIPCSRTLSPGTFAARATESRWTPAACCSSGEPGVQLTWMDAKVGDWVVTPRRGKPVEIQALWYNALCIMEDLARKFGDEAGQKRYRNMATVASWSFNRLFWNENTGCLYDVTNGAPPDPSIRPNQIFAVSLTHSMLSPERARSVVEKVKEHLLTPYGLRSLAPSDPQYRGRYTGGPAERDGAYHQGTVWPWLMGPFITAYVKVNGGSDAARRQAAEWLAPLKRSPCGWWARPHLGNSRRRRASAALLDAWLRLGVLPRSSARWWRMFTECGPRRSQMFESTRPSRARPHQRQWYGRLACEPGPTRKSEALTRAVL